MLLGLFLQTFRCVENLGNLGIVALITCYHCYTLFVCFVVVNKAQIISADLPWLKMQPQQRPFLELPEQHLAWTKSVVNVKMLKLKKIFLTGEMSCVVLLGRGHSLSLLSRGLRLLGQLVGLHRTDKNSV